MSRDCPKCGAPAIETPECPQCAVEVARYRDYLAEMGAGEGALAREGAARGSAGRPAGFWIRAVAVLLDWGFILLVEAVARLGLALVWGRRPSGSRVLPAAFGAFQWLFPPLYSILFHWRFGQTMGKMLLRIRVVAVGDGPLTLAIATGRALAWGLSLILAGAGHLLAGLRRDKRALHDLLAGTRVERL
jgi:uncharacterized RDD family membrane protein YckC